MSGFAMRRNSKALSMSYVSFVFQGPFNIHCVNSTPNPVLTAVYRVIWPGKHALYIHDNVEVISTPGDPVSNFISWRSPTAVPLCVPWIKTTMTPTRKICHIEWDCLSQADDAITNIAKEWTGFKIINKSSSIPDRKLPLCEFFALLYKQHMFHKWQSRNICTDGNVFFDILPS